FLLHLIYHFIFLIMGLIYHYTSVDGLLGIFDKNCLWATDVRFLNDTSETKIFWNLIDASLSHINDEYIIEKSNSIINSIKNNWLFYTVSFCRTPDLLTQWRTYCPNEGGVCIGFDTEAIESDFGQLIDCIYNLEELKYLL